MVGKCIVTLDARVEFTAAPQHYRDHVELRPIVRAPGVVPYADPKNPRFRVRVESSPSGSVFHYLMLTALSMDGRSLGRR
jgi:hypothetical protein